MELVDYVIRTSEKSNETVASKLEKMGLRVGQRLAEKYFIPSFLACQNII